MGRSSLSHRRAALPIGQGHANLGQIPHQCGVLLSLELFVQGHLPHADHSGGKEFSGKRTRPLDGGWGWGSSGSRAARRWASLGHPAPEGLARTESPGCASHFLAGWPRVGVICPVAGRSPGIPRAGIRTLFRALPIVGLAQMRAGSRREIKCVGDEKLH